MKCRCAAALAAVFFSFAAPAAAEQPAADAYREMIQTGKFFLDYTEGTVEHRLTQSDGSRIAERNAPGARGQSKAYKIEAIYRDGKYYKFATQEGKRIAHVLPEGMLGNAALNPEEGWGEVSKQLALPEALAVFSWNDRWVYHAPSVTAPIYNGSSERKMDDQSYACDQYISDIRTQAGTTAGQIVYNMLYADGRLAVVQKYLLHDGQEKLVQTFKIRAFTAEIPADAFEVTPEVTVFNASMGDMSDLLGVQLQVDVLGGEKDAK